MPKVYPKLIFLSLCIIFMLSTCKQIPEKVTYDFSCGVPRTEVNPVSLDTLGIQFVINCDKFWNRKELNVYFIENRIPYHIGNKILSIASEWEKSAKIKFKRTVESQNSQIRISLRNKGYWSKIGNSAVSNKIRPTMTLSYLDTLIVRDEAKARAIILHEFGHALGLLHELQNPQNPIVWDTARVIEYYKREYKWDKNKVYKNVLAPVEYTNSSRFDAQSVMTYPIPKMLTKNQIEIQTVTELSSLDKESFDDCLN